MDVELTKSAKKSIAVIYKHYCSRIKDGQAKCQAVYFEFPPDDISNDIKELKNAGFIKADIVGGIELTDHAIIFMENKTVDTIKEWLSFGAQFLPF